MRRDALVNLLLGVSIALLPLYTRVTALDFNRTGKDNLLVFLFGAFCFLLPSAKRRMTGMMYISFAYILLAVVLNQWHVMSINVMFQSFYILSGVTFFCHYYEKHGSGKSLDYITNGMIVGALIQSAIAIPSYFGFNPYNEFILLLSGGSLLDTVPSQTGRTIGSLGNNNLLGSYLAITLPAFYGLKHKWLGLIPFLALCLTGSLMGICAAIAGLCYFFISDFKIYIYSVTSLVMATFHLYAPKGSDNGRFEIWRDMFSKVDLRHILFGAGPGWFPDQKFMIKNTYVVQEHSGFLSIFNVVGLLGIFLVMPTFIKFVMSKDQNKIFASVLFAAFCSSYGHFVFHQSTVVIIILIAASICVAEGNNNVISL